MTPNIKSFEIPPKQKSDIVLASGGVYLELADSIADSLGIEAIDVARKRHPNDELYARYNDSVREKDVFVIQSHASASGYKIEEAINEHLYLAGAASGSSANSVTAIAPYLAHSRGDRKSKGREAAPAPLLIQFYEAAGVNAMMSIDVHSPQTTEHFRGGSYDHLTAQPELRHAVKEFLGDRIKDCVVVSPDAGAMKNNNRHAKELSNDGDLDIEVIFMGKERAREDSTKIERDKIIAGVEGKICLTFDDMIDSGGTVITAAKTLKNSGAKEVYVGVTHPIFSGDAAKKLAESKIDKVFVADTLPTKKAEMAMQDKLQVVRIGPLIGRAIYEIVTGGSISKIFADQNYR